MQIITKSGKAKILDKLTVAELRVELDRRGLSSKGAKSALSKRLAKASSAGGASAAAPSAHTIDNPLGSFFTKYAQLDEDGDSSEKFIGINGILQLADDLAVDAESDVALLVLFWKLGVTEQGSITERDFMKLGAMQCHNLEQLRAKLPWLRARVRPSQDLSAVYKFAWTFTEPQAKSMELEDAIGLWRMLLADQFKTFDLEAFCKFLTQEHKKKIPRDTYLMLLEFVVGFDGDWSNFDDNSAWPVVLDDYVDYLRENEIIE